MNVGREKNLLTFIYQGENPAGSSTVRLFAMVAVASSDQSLSQLLMKRFDLFE